MCVCVCIEVFGYECVGSSGFHGIMLRRFSKAVYFILRFSSMWPVCYLVVLFCFGYFYFIVVGLKDSRSVHGPKRKCDPFASGCHFQRRR